MRTNYSIMHVDIEEIELDRNNPRIAKFIQMYGENVTEENIALALGVGDSSVDDSSTTFQSLKASIKTNGGIIHPIIVNKEEDGKYLAIEGNTRVAIYKEFKQSDSEGKWDKIPAVVYDSMAQEEIDSVRLQAHLVGPRQWDPYSKAKYLDYLSEQEHLTAKQIVDFCGGRETEIRDYIDAYKEMEKYYRPLIESDDEFDPKRFSAFVELQRKNVRDAIVSTGFTYNDFARWVKDFKIHPLNSVRKLPLILRSKRARQAFINHPGKGAIDEALKEIEQPTADAALSEASLEQLSAELVKRIRKFEYEKLQNLKSNSDSSEAETIFEARDSIIQLCNDIDPEK